MELSSRQIVALAAPLVVSYLTYTTVKGAQMLQASNVVKAARATTSRHAAAGADTTGKTRDPFTPMKESAKSPTSALAAVLLGQVGKEEKAAEAAAREEKLPLRLDGTVITSRWRFAILNGDRVVEGQVYSGLKVESIEAERVVLSGGGETINVDLEIARVAESEPVPAAVQPGLGGLSPLAPGGTTDILQALGIPRS